ncbi:Nramp family divalent metal transporter [Lutimonas halocynthiae]|uniref:Nramp family divalent metal transporter n=1 Tax=Lutimonas halocynthiae TaxID=1446477 RepID=UPI0025B3CC0F|nr:Nramp family divalent metal transporter [Lutimonas halocynthiae]MDN3644491.1 Nramp family divalent metal transporter [Lutimonas halocynthiae]
MNKKVFKAFKNLGPGLLFAGAAIGVSHLVQSTRAGADFGFGLLWALLLVNLFKYPFFQYGPRYAAATGESLIDGYKKLGNWVLISYFILTFLTMFTIQAAVTIVTAGLAENLFGLTSNLSIWSILITMICLGILLIGKYKALDKTMKVIISVLAFSSIIAVCVAIFKTDHTYSFSPQIPEGAVELTFLIAFLGWMPAPLDVSTWHSLWTLEKSKGSKTPLDSKKSLLDFNVGYVMTVFLGICFMSLGALVMYHSEEEISSSASVFAKQLISLYTDNLGKGAAIFIGIAAFTTMFSTTLTTLDASPRAMAKSSELLSGKSNKSFYLGWIFILALGTLIILSYFKTNMITFVKIATVLSFLTAPFYAIANFILVKGKHMPEEKRPSKYLSALSYLGIIFLVFFSVWFLTSV